MNIDSATYHDLSAASEPLWKLRIVVQGSHFMHRAKPIAAEVGQVPVEVIVIDAEGDRFVGLLGALPNNGDVLKVGYLGGQLLNTGLAYSASSVVV